MSNNISFCALDLETTGLNSKTDHIIEIGLQLFTLGEIGETYSTLVKPAKRIPKNISLLTGIKNKDVKEAPSIEDIAEDIRSFIGDHTIVGHNIRFDLSFLASHGIKLKNNSFDTLDFSYMMIPNAPNHTLGGLADYLNLTQANSHRALSDSITSMDLFKKLSAVYLGLSTSVAGQIASLHQRSDSSLNTILTHLLTLKLEGTENNIEVPLELDAQRGVITQDQETYGQETNIAGSHQSISAITVEDIFRDTSKLSTVISGYEDREGQMEMAQLVEESLETSSKLIVEAGTGIGKSMAYLMPSILHGLKNDQKIVISTNTINLQDQLMEKDIPNAISVIGNQTKLDNNFSFNVLKGSQNYLCKRRLETQLNRTQINPDQAVFLSKILVWIGQTTKGDRAELNLNRPGQHSMWRRINADSPDYCGIRHNNCYLRKARELASSSHILVVNHSLLMANLKSGMSIIPNHDCLILDEAHHLEEEATNAFGFEITEDSMYEIIDLISTEGSSLDTAANLIKNQFTSKSDLSSIATIRSRVNTTSEIVKSTVKNLFSELSSALFTPDIKRSGFQNSQETRIRILSSHRDDQWKEISLFANTLSAQITSIIADVENITYKLEALSNHNGAADLMAEINNSKSDLVDVTSKLIEITLHPNKDAVYWVNQRGESGALSICMAPTEIATKLSETLYDQTSNIIMTSATLTSNDDFDHLMVRTGFDADKSAIIPSPFPYLESAILVLAKNLPDPRQPEYYASLAKVILDSAEGAGGKTLCLFTSHKSIRRVYDLMQKQIGGSGLHILAQGISGSTQNIIKRLREDPNCVVLGTASLWEGIDIKGEALELLIITRLPFGVPTDPIYQARSETYENPFIQYALPNAILRFRQGFGRLIRSSTDRGVALILDSRISNARYGRYFVNSLPEMNVRQLESDQIGSNIEKWLYQ